MWPSQFLGIMAKNLLNSVSGAETQGSPWCSSVAHGGNFETNMQFLSVYGIRHLALHDLRNSQ